MFLPPGRLTPTLPPTELSTCASSVVGTMTKPQPAGERGGDEPGQVADHAAAQRHDERLPIGAFGQQLFHRSSAAAVLLLVSPGSTTSTFTSQPSSTSRSPAASAYRSSTVESVMISGVLALRTMPQKIAQPHEGAAANLNIIAPLGQRHANGLNVTSHKEPQRLCRKSSTTDYTDRGSRNTNIR